MLSIKAILLFIVLLSVIVIVHECGHLIVAKLFDVYCQEFSVGMGPKLFSVKGRETEYALRAIPFGGFVAMAGDTDNELETSVDTENIPKERTLPGIAPWKRILVMIAGIIMNILLATVIMSLVLLHIGQYSVSPEAYINTVSPNSPAEAAGLKDGDRILHAELENGTSIAPKTFMELSAFLDTYDGVGKIYLEVEREGETLNISVKPEYDQKEERYLMCITSNPYTLVEVNWKNCLHYAVDHLSMMTSLLISSLLNIFRGVGLKNLSGPIGVYTTTAQAVEMGALYYFQLMAMISLNVGIFNALPLPVLDGGRVLLTFIEMIIGRPIPEKVQNAIMSVSVVLVLLLFVFVTFQDVLKLF